MDLTKRDEESAGVELGGKERIYEIRKAAETRRIKGTIHDSKRRKGIEDQMLVITTDVELNTL